MGGKTEKKILTKDLLGPLLAWESGAVIPSDPKMEVMEFALRALYE
jgi:hypothetical protein